MFIHTLDDTVWSVADIVGVIGTGTSIFHLTFTANNVIYTCMRFEDDLTTLGTPRGKLYFDNVLAVEYPTPGWAATAYQHIEIAGGPDATNPALITWFLRYAKNITATTGSNEIADALGSIADVLSSHSGGIGNVTASVDANTGTPSVDVTTSGSAAQKNINFTFHNLKGEQGAPGADGQPGADGAPGQDGQDGAAATIAVGTVTTGAAGSSATVTNVGTSNAAIFDFTIPQGAPGAAGMAPGAHIRLPALHRRRECPGPAGIRQR